MSLQKNHVIDIKIYNKDVLFQIKSKVDFIQRLLKVKPGNSHIYGRCKQGIGLW